MRPFSPLPEPLARRPFALAEAWPTGLTQGRARGRDLAAPYWGVRTPGPSGAFLDRVLAADQIRAVDEAFSHETAARLLELPLPRPWEDDEQIHICGETELPRLRRVGIVSHRGLERRLVVTSHGVPAPTLRRRGPIWLGSWRWTTSSCWAMRWCAEAAVCRSQTFAR